MNLKPQYEIGFKEKRKSHYFTVGDRELRSVTYYLGIIDKSRPLMIWAVNQALGLVEKELRAKLDSGISPSDQFVAEIIAAGKAQPEATKQEAADIGTLAHKAIDEFILGQKPEMNPQTKIVFDNFMKWLLDNDFEILQGDTPVASLIHGYGGRLDAIAQNKRGEIVILDWKTGGKRIYTEAHLQVAAYAQAYAETFNMSIPSTGWIVHFNKELPEFDTAKVNIQRSLQAFLCAKSLKDGITAIEKEIRNGIHV